MAGNTARPGTTVASRVLALLTAFDEAHRRLSLTDLARRAGLALPTAHRLVGELTALGALDRTPQREYVLGRLMWSLGLLAPTPTDLRDTASPFLHDLYAATRATVHLAVRDGARVLYLDRISGNRSVPVVSQIGSHLPLHPTGVGKVLLAYAPDDVREQVLGTLQRITPYTVTQPLQLRHQLDRVVAEGYATTVEEMSLGACSIAVPIRHHDAVVAALGVVVPTIERDRPRLVGALQVAANGITRNLDRSAAQSVAGDVSGHR